MARREAREASGSCLPVGAPLSCEKQGSIRNFSGPSEDSVTCDPIILSARPQLLASFTTFSEDRHSIALSKPQHHLRRMHNPFCHFSPQAVL